MMRKNQKGFTLIEILLVIGVIMIMSVIKIKSINEETEDLRAKFFSDQIKTVEDATNAFLVLKYNELSNLSYSGISCNSGVNTCDLTLDNLSNAGLLPPNFSKKTILGNPYEIQLKRTGTAPNYMLSGLILTKGIKVNESVPSYIFLGKVLTNIGRDGGLNKKNNEIVGTANGWSADQSLFPILSNKINYIGASVGSLSGAYYVYLRRDGSLPMTGDLNMDGNNINNINNLNATGNLITKGDIKGKNISATGNIVSEGNITSTGTINSGTWINAKNGYGDTISIGGDGGGEDYEIKLLNSNNRKLTLWNSANGSSPNNTNKDVTILKIAGASLTGSINSVGSITASGNIKGDTIQLSSSNNYNDKCNEVGLISRDINGNILSCIDSKWMFIGEQPGSIKIWGSQIPPDGWLELNGQSFDTTKNKLLAQYYPSGVLPDFRGQFVRAWDHGKGIDSESSRDINSLQEDAIRNIKGEFKDLLYQTENEARKGTINNGAFRRANYGESGKNASFFVEGSKVVTDPQRDDAIIFDASRTVPVASENRVKNITSMYIIKKG